MTTAADVIVASWALFLLVWLVLSFFVKRDVRGGRSARVHQVRVLVIIVIIIVALRFTGRPISGTTIFYNRASVFLPSLTLAWIGAVLTALGVVLAIWARLAIGRNWSPRPAVKEGHELVTSGPYALIRHPIYSGIILAALGTALTGSIFGVCIFLFVSVLFLWRVGKEERIMLDLFPAAYPAYQTRTKRLIPLIW